ncbi:MAG: disulfide bond formation protein B [Azospira oryzae]|nr:MAG: disulfide bond formation protein B [Azospira oryzae]PZP79472.1 MAG: disulfide bond formation protein B [Azospira oryzae]
MRTRAGFFAGFLLCLGVLGYALYLQHGQGLEPCPLCIFQRAVFIVLGALFLLAAVHGPGPKGATAYAGLITAAAAGGVVIAARHLWVQFGAPPQVADCGADLSFMLETLPLSETLALVFRGSGECSDTQWSFLGLTLPGWSLVFYLVLAALGIFVARQARRSARA